MEGAATGCVAELAFLPAPLLQVFGPNKNTSVVAVTNFQGCEREAAQLLELAHQVRGALIN